MDSKQHSAAYEEVRRDIEELERRLAQLRLVAEYHRQKAGVPAGGANSSNEPLSRNESPRNGRFSANISQRQAAALVLGESPKPMKTLVIAKKMIADGYPSNDIKKLKTSLFTTMTRQKRIFGKAGRGLWKLKEAEV